MIIIIRVRGSRFEGSMLNVPCKGSMLKDKDSMSEAQGVHQSVMNCEAVNLCFGVQSSKLALKRDGANNTIENTYINGHPIVPQTHLKFKIYNL